MRFLTKRGTVMAMLCGVLIILTVFSCLNSKQPAVSSDTIPAKGKTTSFKGVWINYLEFAAMISGKTMPQYQAQVEQVIDNLTHVGLNAVFLHVRSHSDSLYPSDLFPWSVYINGGNGVDYDPLALFVQLAHQKGVAVHAWVNPYRISKGTLTDLTPEHPAYPWREDGNHVVEIDEGVYYNPSSAQVRTLVLDGVREVLEQYDVDGIHYDDYFYPTTDEEFDRVAYHQYCDRTDHPLPLAEWRRNQVNLLIAGTYQLSRQYDVMFGVSPAADVDKNYHSLYADVAAWAQGGYVDYLCPQLYFGFNYPDEKFRFKNLLQTWETLAQSTPLYIGIASYKVGTEDAGSKEWITATDVLARETELIASSKVADGVCIYHYSSLMKQDDLSVTQQEALQNVLSTFS